ncbi:5146_t:CDS:2 [Entrophospora sp. SA101]|nr:5146_t:CDS:2 [Entrophospora sp. SA101]
MGLGFSCLGFSAVPWITSTVISCFSAAACNLGCKSCNCNNSIATRVGYAIIFLINSMLAWLMLSDWAIKHLEKITHLHLSCPEGTCYGVLAVHRVCFALSLFHLIIGLLVIKVNSTRDKRASIQNGWWGPKVIFWIFLLVISFFIPNEFFVFWSSSVSLIGAAIFILVGLIILVDFVHSWSESCIEKWQEEDKELWKYILIGSTLFFFIASIVLTGIMYKFFGGSGCHTNQFFITFNLILCVIGTILSIHPIIQEKNSRSGLSQSSMVVFYCTYLILSAVVNEPHDDNDGNNISGSDYDDNSPVCNPLLKTANSARTTTVIIGAFFTFIAVAYSTSRAATDINSFITKSDYHPINTATAVPLTTNQSNGNMRSDSLLAAVESGYAFLKIIIIWRCVCVYTH